MVAMGISLMSICCLRIRSNNRSSGPSYCSRWKLSGEDTIFHDSMRRTNPILGWPVIERLSSNLAECGHEGAAGGRVERVLGHPDFRNLDGEIFHPQRGGEAIQKALWNRRPAAQHDGHRLIQLGQPLRGGNGGPQSVRQRLDDVVVIHR